VTGPATPTQEAAPGLGLRHLLATEGLRREQVQVLLAEHDGRDEVLLSSTGEPA